MTQRRKSYRHQFFPFFSILLVGLCVVLAIVSIRSLGHGVVHADPAETGRHIYLQDGFALQVTHAGPQSVTGAFKSGSAEPTSLATGDFDEDGIDDVVIGYGSRGAGMVAV